VHKDAEQSDWHIEVGGASQQIVPAFATVPLEQVVAIDEQLPLPDDQVPLLQVKFCPVEGALGQPLQLPPDGGISQPNAIIQQGFPEGVVKLDCVLNAVQSESDVQGNDEAPATIGFISAESGTGQAGSALLRGRPAQDPITTLRLQVPPGQSPEPLQGSPFVQEGALVQPLVQASPIQFRVGAGGEEVGVDVICEPPEHPGRIEGTKFTSLQVALHSPGAVPASHGSPHDVGISHW
jgi:hypothetical protein